TDEADLAFFFAIFFEKPAKKQETHSSAIDADKTLSVSSLGDFKPSRTLSIKDILRYERISSYK
ncbi:MAG: hypothetical protein ACFFB3_21895, partial [Candidatus Hodarchaeota archaeon]